MNTATWLRLGNAAERLGMTRPAFQRVVARGHIPYHEIDGVKFFDKADLDTYTHVVAREVEQTDRTVVFAASDILVEEGKDWSRPVQFRFEKIGGQWSLVMREAA